MRKNYLLTACVALLSMVSAATELQASDVLQFCILRQPHSYRGYSEVFKLSLQFSHDRRLCQDDGWQIFLLHHERWCYMG